jgi:uncharacterized protein (TIRG00374 family)
MAATNRKILATVLGGLISLCLLGVLLKSVNLHSTWQTLRGISPRRLLLPLLMFALNFPLRALRWQLIFPKHVRPGYWLTFRTLAIGTGANNFAPGRVGDVARCVMISQDSLLSGTALALATFAVEKVLDGLELFSIVLLTCLYTRPPIWLTNLGIAAMFVFGGVLAVICVFRFKTERFMTCLQAVLAATGLKFLTKRATTLFVSFNAGLNALTSLAQVVSLVAITSLVWITDAGLVWGIAKALSLPLSIPYSLLVVAVIGLGLIFPVAPASIGTYEFFVVTAMGLAGIGSSSALAYALLLHSWVFVTTSILGLTCLAWTGLSLKQLVPEEKAWEARGAPIAEVVP